MKMPYRNAWIYCLAIIAMTVLAFWPGYFSRLGTAKIAWHIHAITATVWPLLLAAQSWSIDRGHRARHRSLGLAIFLLVPLFLVGAAGVEHSMAMATASGKDPFYKLWGSPLGLHDLIGSAAFLLFSVMALKDRRNVARHAAWLLATPVLLIGPALARVYNAHLPGLIITGPQDFPLFRWSVHLGGLTGVAIALSLWSRHRRHGQPWLMVATIIVLQSLLFETMGFSKAWTSLFLALGDSSGPVHAAGAGMIAAAALWWSWRAVPQRPASSAVSVV
jgi:phosphoglycerol transferase MdoB-like AlkP superfamily enzyme